MYTLSGFFVFCVYSDFRSITYLFRLSRDDTLADTFLGSPFVFILDRLLESLKLEESSWLLDFVWFADAELRDDVNDDIKELGWDGEKDFLSFCGPSLNKNVVICEIF